MGILDAIKKLSFGPGEEKQNQLNWLKNVHINIDIQGHRDFYSSGDTIQGLVHLELDELVEVGDVDIVYSVVASTEIYLDDTSSSSDSSVSSDAPSSQEESELSVKKLEKKYDKKQRKLHRRKVKEQTREEASNKKFAKLSWRHEQRRNSGRKSNTMASSTTEHEQVIKVRGGSLDEPMMKPGSYSFPFNIQLPGHAGDGYEQGLTSFEVAYGMGRIEHVLKAKVYRKSQFGQLQHCSKTIGFKTLSEPSPTCVPSQSRKDRLFFSVGGPFSRRTVEYSASATLPEAIWNKSQFNVPIKVSFTDGCQFSVASILVELAMETTIEAQSETEKLLDRITLYQDLKKHVLDKDSLAAKLSNIRAPEDAVPSFDTKHLGLKYWIEVNIEIYALKQHKQVKTLNFKLPVTVYASCASERERPAQLGTSPVAGSSEKAEMPPDYGAN